MWNKVRVTLARNMIFVGVFSLALVFVNYALILKWLPKTKRDFLAVLALSIITLVMFYSYFTSPINTLPNGNDQAGRFFETFITANNLSRIEDAVWSSLWYCGYAINHFYPPAAKYEGAIYALLFDALDYSAVDSVMLAMKLQTILSFLFSGLAFYLLARSLKTSRTGALVGSVAFLVATWHIQSITISRFDEFFLLPLLLVAYHRSLRGGSFVWAGISMATLLLVHQHSFLAGAVFLGLFALVKTAQSRELRPLKIFGLTTVSGLGLSAFWWLPYLFEAGRTFGYLYPGFPSNTAWSQSMRILVSYVSRPSAPTGLGWYYPTYLGLSVIFLAFLAVRVRNSGKAPWWIAILGVIVLTLPVAYLTPYIGNMLARIVRVGSTGVFGDLYPDWVASMQIRLITGAVMGLCYLASVGVDHISDLGAVRLRISMPRARIIFASLAIFLILFDFSNSVRLVTATRPPIYNELNTWIAGQGGVFRTWTDTEGGPAQSVASMATVYSDKPFVAGWQAQSANSQLIEFLDGITDMLNQNMTHVPELLGVLNVRYLVVYPETDFCKICPLQKHLESYPEFRQVQSFHNGTLLVYQNEEFLPIIRAVVPVYRHVQGGMLNTLEFASSEYYNDNVSFVTAVQNAEVIASSFEGLANLAVKPVTNLRVELLDNGLTASFSTSAPTYLAISLSQSPDWTGTLDGHDVELFSIEPAMIGVQVPDSGAHVISLRYSTDNVVHLTSELLTVLTVLILLASRRFEPFVRLRKVWWPRRSRTAAEGIPAIG